MEYRDWLWLAIVVATVILGWINSRAAYFNGVTDGVGYVFDRKCPGYRQAGEYVRKYLHHRWPRLAEGCEVAFLIGPEIRPAFPLEEELK